MARCPVCKTECGESTRCSSCGFDDIRSEFLNQEEYDFWVKNIVKAYKPIHEIDYSDFKINGPVLYCARLDAYVGNSSEVIIPSGITRIAKGAFANNKKITRVVLSADIREIGDNAFENCENLIEICLPEKLKKIGEYAFLNCKSLKEIEFLSMTNSIGAYAFYGCLSLASVKFSATASPLSIGEKAFADCSSLLEVDYPLTGSQIRVGDRCFLNCISLKRMVIPQNLSLGYSVFQNCNLTIFLEKHFRQWTWLGSKNSRVFAQGTWHYEGKYAVPNEKAYEHLV